MKALILVLITVFTSISLNAACMPCSCSESNSQSMNMEYNTEIIKVTNEKITPKMMEISAKVNRIKALQDEINKKLASLETIEVEEFIMHKKKNFELERIIAQVSMNIGGATLLNKTIMAGIKTKINMLATVERPMASSEINTSLIQRK